MGAPHETGRLCVAGDWACIHGDLVALSYLARRIAETAPPPLHDELAQLAERCEDADQRARADAELARAPCASRRTAFSQPGAGVARALFMALPPRVRVLIITADRELRDDIASLALQHGYDVLAAANAVD